MEEANVRTRNNKRNSPLKKKTNKSRKKTIEYQLKQFQILSINNK